MGGVLNAVHLARGLEPFASFHVHHVRALHWRIEHGLTNAVSPQESGDEDEERLQAAKAKAALSEEGDLWVEGDGVPRQRVMALQDVCVTPALWEHAFGELLGITGEEARQRAFAVIDTDCNGLVDVRETLGALAVISKGSLSERMALVFQVFDLNQCSELLFQECFMMLRRTVAGLRKFVGIVAPPEKVLFNMTRHIFQISGRPKTGRIVLEDWYNWWSRDATVRGVLKLFVRKRDDARGLPTPDTFVTVDYTRRTEEPGSGALRPISSSSGGGGRRASRTRLGSGGRYGDRGTTRASLRKGSISSTMPPLPARPGFR
eukprot:TRINITY_DN38217_c0_g1_i1.p1 TRINITY_DN38217_c0_g1~~TRINITY_DN38217_c0_g1_i1.p1  ORF type:complete len:319 (+),score=58.32 TRINITY_DN38217_c0_g1_i1:100-1056(+)